MLPRRNPSKLCTILVWIWQAGNRKIYLLLVITWNCTFKKAVISFIPLFIEMKLITALLKAYKFADDQQKVFVFPVLSNSPRWLDTVKGDETGLTFQLTSTSSLPTQPMKGYTTPPGFTSPTLYEQQCGFFYVPRESEQWKSCETGPTVFRFYPRRLECLTICRCHNKGHSVLTNTRV